MFDLDLNQGFRLWGSKIIISGFTKENYLDDFAFQFY